MEYNRNSPTTSGGNTPTFPPTTEGNMAGMNPQMAMNPMAGMNPQMAMNPGMGGSMPGMNPQMAGMNPQMMYTMFNWMMQGAAGMGGMTPGMGGMTPGMVGMGGMTPGMVGMGGSMQQMSPQTPRESVYRPYMDLLADDTPTSVPETQYGGIETFSFDELGLSPIRETPGEAEEPAARGRGRPRGSGRGKGRGKGKGKASSSSSHAGAEEEEDGDEPERRTIWTGRENAALASAWRGVCEDPYQGANQYLDRLWYRIAEAYLTRRPPGAKARSSEQCRKQWLRLRPKLSRFAALYENNMRMATSGMSEEDVKDRALAQFPDRELKFKEFDQWEAFLVVKDSQKFCGGVESGWKRTKINSSGEYSSSAGSHELPDAEEEAPLPRSDSRRRRRPMGQQAAQRMARGGGSGSRSYEVESEAPGAPDPNDRLARSQVMKTLMQCMREWRSTSDPAFRRMCKDLIDTCRRDLGLPPIDDFGNEIGGGDLGGGSGTGDGDEAEDEEE